MYPNVRFSPCSHDAMHCVPNVHICTFPYPRHTESHATPHFSNSYVLCADITTVQWTNCTTASPNLICWHGPPMSKGGTAIGATHGHTLLSVKSSRGDDIKITGVCTTHTSIVLSSHSTSCPSHAIVVSMECDMRR